MSSTATTSQREATFAQARGFVKDGRHRAARPLLEALHAQDTGDMRVAGWLGCSLAMGGKLGRAEPLLHKAVDGVEGFGRAQRTLLRVTLQQYDYAGARRLWERFAPDGIAATFFSIDQADAVGPAFTKAHERHAGRTVPDVRVYYHMPFTGGTSWQNVLVQLYARGHRYNVRRKSGLPRIARLYELDAGTKRRLDYAHVHHPFPIDWAGRVGRTARWFTVVRDPLGHFLSGYNKRVGKASVMETRDIAAAKGLAASVEHAAAHGLANPQSKQLAIFHPAVAGRFTQRYRSRKSWVPIRFEDDLFFYEATAGIGDDELLDLASEAVAERFYPLGVLAHMDASYLATLAALGIPVAPRFPQRGKSPAREPVAEGISDRIVALNAVDQRLFERARADFERREAALVAATS